MLYVANLFSMKTITVATKNDQNKEHQSTTKRSKEVNGWWG